tara:strand:+ start:156 stop:335 length:180 start_codon:yes stop_codon:yes gene_type:complete
MLRYKNGGATRDRTADLLNAIQALSQLSYSPIENDIVHEMNLEYTEANPVSNYALLNLV